MTANLSSGVALIDENGQFSLYNPAFLRMFGLAENASISNVNDQRWGNWQVFDEDGKLLHVDSHPVRKAALTGEAVRDQLVGVKPPAGGDVNWMVVSAAPTLGSHGRRAIICTYHDVTARKRAEEALREVEREERIILDNANEVIAYHDTGNNLVWANRAYLKATGLALSALKGTKCFRCWGLDRLCEHCPVTTAIQTGEPQEAELTPENQAHWPAHQGSWLVRAAPVKDSAATSSERSKSLTKSPRRSGRRSSCGRARSDCDWLRRQRGWALKTTTSYPGKSVGTSGARELWGVAADVPITKKFFQSGLHPEDLAGVQAAVDRSPGFHQ